MEPDLTSESMGLPANAIPRPGSTHQQTGGSRKNARQHHHTYYHYQHIASSSCDTITSSDIGIPTPSHPSIMNATQAMEQDLALSPSSEDVPSPEPEAQSPVTPPILANLHLSIIPSEIWWTILRLCRMEDIVRFFWLCRYTRHILLGRNVMELLARDKKVRFGDGSGDDGSRDVFASVKAYVATRHAIEHGEMGVRCGTRHETAVIGIGFVDSLPDLSRTLPAFRREWSDFSLISVDQQANIRIWDTSHAWGNVMPNGHNSSDLRAKRRHSLAIPRAKVLHSWNHLAFLVSPHAQLIILMLPSLQILQEIQIPSIANNSRISLDFFPTEQDADSVSFSRGHEHSPDGRSAYERRRLIGMLGVTDGTVIQIGELDNFHQVRWVQTFHLAQLGIVHVSSFHLRITFLNAETVLIVSGHQGSVTLVNLPSKSATGHWQVDGPVHLSEVNANKFEFWFGHVVTVHGDDTSKIGVWNISGRKGRGLMVGSGNAPADPSVLKVDFGLGLAFIGTSETYQIYVYDISMPQIATLRLIPSPSFQPRASAAFPSLLQSSDYMGLDDPAGVYSPGAMSIAFPVSSRSSHSWHAGKILSLTYHHTPRGYVVASGAYDATVLMLAFPCRPSLKAILACGK